MNTALVSHGSADPVLQALMEITQLQPAQFSELTMRAHSTGKAIEALMVEGGHADRGDVLEAMSKARMDVSVARLSDLPAWDRIISMTDEMLPGPRDALFIINTKEPRKRGFLMVASDAQDPRVLANDGVGLTSKAVRAGFNVAGRMTVTRGFIATVVAEWQRRQTGHETNNLSDEQLEFDRIGLDAYQKGASDIHLTVLDGRGFISYRIDGELEHVEDRPAEAIEAVAAAAYNTLSEAGSTKSDFNPREYQDSSIERVFGVGMIRFRYSSVPLSPSGFDVTLRIVPIGVDQGKRSVSALGYSWDQEDKIARAFSHSSGMVLWVGTTGSGKSTSMAAVLEQLAEDYPGKKVRTVEEPVEARIRGAYQTPVLKKKEDGSDFKAVLRQLMRSDPDVMMIGEIRDDATADLAIQAVRTGHLCLSTLHCQGAPGVYDRLVGMGVPRSDVATVGLFLAFIFQSLVQRLCDNCKTPAAMWVERNPGHPIVPRLLRYTDGQLEGIFFENAEGCSRCKFKGRAGRTACAEILVPTPDVCRAVMAGDSAEVWRLWRSEINQNDPSDMTGRTAFEHALYKMSIGMVSPLAVERAFRFVDEPAFPGGRTEAAHG